MLTCRSTPAIGALAVYHHLQPSTRLEESTAIVSSDDYRPPALRSSALQNPRLFCGKDLQVENTIHPLSPFQQLDLDEAPKNQEKPVAPYRPPALRGLVTHKETGSPSTNPTKRKIQSPISPYRPPPLRALQYERSYQSTTPRRICIRSVGPENLEKELSEIRFALLRYTFATIDTEFERPIHHSSIHYRCRSPEQRYQLMKKNVDSLHMTQLGLTLTDSDGQLPHNTIWEFDFQIFEDEHYRKFADMFLSSGLFGSHSFMTWITFGGVYDFGYIMKILLQCKELPTSLDDFMSQVTNLFGPRFFDVKHLATTLLHSTIRERIGLNDLARELGVRRVAGTSHHGASDSLLTWHIFQKVRSMIQDNKWEASHNGVICGLHVI